ncbi:MAG TPA: hypothetical protein DEO40_06725 [Treponema sp.]|nr:hypothetical protein [Treponema sp.]HAK69374.1 hypothetical protein [Treponema sp.]HBB42394.1 hypothetical protein [Treponema sp.]HCA20353.1 hypothetical protein [Treponema sp.]
MPVKLIAVLALAVFVASFTGFNLDNRCNLWLFHKFENLPVVTLVMASFIAGVIVTLPFTFGKSRRNEKPGAEVNLSKKRKPRKETLPAAAEYSSDQNQP